MISSESLLEPMLDSSNTERESMKSRLERSMAIAVGFMCLEILGGILAGSLAIVTDAAHVLSDVSGMAVSLFALDLMIKKPTMHYTYGFHQAEIIGALVSVMLVWAITGVLLFEAWNRFAKLTAIDGGLMVSMAAIGLVVNIVMLMTLGHHHNPLSHGHSHHSSHSRQSSHSSHTGSAHRVPDRGNLVMQAAFIHILGDIVQSVGVLIAAALIWWQPIDIGTTADGINKWNYADPFCTVLFGLIVLYTTFGTVRQCVRILMQKVPENINPAAFAERLKSVQNVSCVHDIHVWAIGSSNPLCTAHVVITNKDASMQVLADCIKVAQSMDLNHSTFQLEVEGDFDHHLESFGNVHASSDRMCCDPVVVATKTETTVMPITIAAPAKHKHSSSCKHTHYH